MVNPAYQTPASSVRPYRSRWIRWATALLLAMLVPSAAKADVWFLGIGNDGYFTDVSGLRSAYQAAPNAYQTPLHFQTYSNHGGSSILGDINWLAGNTRPGDYAFFYYSGHGGHRPDGNGDELAGWALDQPDETIGRSTSWCTDDQLASALAAINPQVLVVAVFDSCYAGGMVGGRDDLNCLANVYVMMSSREDQPSYGGDPYSRFTAPLIDGIGSSLPADADGNGTVTFNEWFGYARDQTYGQDPVCFDAGGFGSLSIVPVPEPTTLALSATALAGLLFWRRRRCFRLGRVLKGRDGLDRFCCAAGANVCAPNRKEVG